MNFLKYFKVKYFIVHVYQEGHLVKISAVQQKSGNLDMATSKSS